MTVTGAPRTVRTRATRFAPWATARLTSRRTVVHETTGVTLTWADGVVVRRYVDTRCGKALPDGQLARIRPDFPPCRECENR